MPGRHRGGAPDQAMIAPARPIRSTPALWHRRRCPRKTPSPAPRRERDCPAETLRDRDDLPSGRRATSRHPAAQDIERGSLEGDQSGGQRGSGWSRLEARTATGHTHSPRLFHIRSPRRARGSCDRRPAQPGEVTEVALSPRRAEPGIDDLARERTLISVSAARFIARRRMKALPPLSRPGPVSRYVRACRPRQGSSPDIRSAVIAEADQLFAIQSSSRGRAGGRVVERVDG
jgi:hypothetical protein